MFLADTQQIRRTDQVMIETFDFPGILLMETAGRKSAEQIIQDFPNQDLYLILAGPGNNGGDGLVIARYLMGWQKQVRIICPHDPETWQGDAGINWKHLRHLQPRVIQYEAGTAEDLFQELPAQTLVVDALLGTGVNSTLRGPLAELVAYFRGREFPAVAIDLPSGLSSDTGNLMNEPIPARFTCTFALPKICHFLTPAANYCGEIRVVEIGIRPEVVDGLGIKRRLLTHEFIRQHYRGRATDSHKGSHGHAWLAGGSKSMAGAIVLAARSALHMGAGLSTALVPGSARCALYRETAEVMNRSFGNEDQAYLEAGAVAVWQEAGLHTSALAIGPGLDKNAQTLGFVRAMLFAWQGPLVLDADALNLLSENPELWDLLPENTILTPHPGEMARLTGVQEVQSHRLELAEELAARRKVIVVLKGAGTVIAFPNGDTWVNCSGNAGMATAGSGDVLTGAITAWLAQGYTPQEAALMGVYLHGLAGDLLAAEAGQEGVTAEGLISFLSPALQKALQETGNFPVLV